MAASHWRAKRDPDVVDGAATSRRAALFLFVFPSAQQAALEVPHITVHFSIPSKVIVPAVRSLTQCQVEVTFLILNPPIR